MGDEAITAHWRRVPWHLHFAAAVRGQQHNDNDNNTMTSVCGRPDNV